MFDTCNAEDIAFERKKEKENGILNMHKQMNAGLMIPHPTDKTKSDPYVNNLFEPNFQTKGRPSIRDESEHDEIVDIVNQNEAEVIHKVKLDLAS